MCVGQVRVSDATNAYRWRLQAEHAMRASGRPAMTDEQVRASYRIVTLGFLCYLCF